MSTLIQFDFFKSEQESEFEAIRKELDEVKESSSRVRKKLFAENGKLVKTVIDLQERLEILERNICKGKYETR